MKQYNNRNKQENNKTMNLTGINPRSSEAIEGKTFKFYVNKFGKINTLCHDRESADDNKYNHTPITLNRSSHAFCLQREGCLVLMHIVFNEVVNGECSADYDKEVPGKRYLHTSDYLLSDAQSLSQNMNQFMGIVASCMTDLNRHALIVLVSKV